MKIDVSYTSRRKSYSLVIQKGLLQKAGMHIKQVCENGRLIILTNNKVRRLWGNGLEQSLKIAGLDYQVISIPDGEKYKNLNMYNTITAKLLRDRYDRNATLVTFGGGVIGDLGGFVAATFKRGIKLIHIPTSLVAQVDASIGGKVAIDLPEGKNMIGAFYNPRLILTDPKLLSTLETRQYINGLFEIIKIALVCDPELLEYIENNYDNILARKMSFVDKMVCLAANDKVQIVSDDPYEANIRIILNNGHTLGHALETVGEYKNITHGEAVGYGMLLAVHLAHHLRISRHDESSKPYQLISNLLKKRAVKDINASRLWKIICNDKKAENHKVRFVLLEDVGIPKIVSVSKLQFMEAWNKLCDSTLK